VALFSTTSLQPVIEGRASCGSSFVRLFIRLLVAGVEDGVFSTRLRTKKKKMEEKEAPAAYLPTQEKQAPVSDIAMCR